MTLRPRQRGRWIRETHLAYPSDVFIAGPLVKSEVFIQAETDVVPVQSVREFVQME